MTSVVWPSLNQPADHVTIFTQRKKNGGFCADTSVGNHIGITKIFHDVAPNLHSQNPTGRCGAMRCGFVFYFYTVRCGLKSCRAVRFGKNRSVPHRTVPAS